MSLQPENMVTDESSKKRKLEELVEPVKPEMPVSTRRSVLDKLGKSLHSEVVKLVKQRAEATVSNLRKYNILDPVLRGKPLTDVGQERTRQAVAYMHQAFEEVKQERQIDRAVAGPVKSGDSLLTQGGENESVKGAVKQYVTDSGNRELAYPFGTRRGGASSDADEVHAVNPGFKVGSQTLQILGHLSQLFMKSVNDMEYESMLVNDRVFVAANAQGAIKSFAARTLDEFLTDAAKDIVADTDTSDKVRPYKIGSVAAALKLDETSEAPLTQQEKDGARMLAEYEIGHHVDHASRSRLKSILDTLQHQAKNRLQMLGPFAPDEAKKYIATAAHKHHVILVQTPGKSGWHAEQALVMTLIEGKWKSGASVSGTKRPCFVCWLTLNLLPQRGYPLEINQEPGFFWESNTVPALTHVAKALGVRTVSELLAHFDLAQHYTQDKFIQFMTALTEQDVLEVDVKNDELGQDGRNLTQAQSQRSFYLSHDTTEITSAPFPAQRPASPVGTYGTPPNSPGVQRDKAMMVEYEGKQKKYDEEMAEFQKAKKAREATKGDDAKG